MKPRIKPEKIGSTTSTKSLGTIVIAERHTDILIREGRTDLIDGISSAKKLVPLKDKTLKELRKSAKGIEGYSLKLSKTELIDLINANPKS